jgi:hypothetical protein
MRVVPGRCSRRVPGTTGVISIKPGGSLDDNSV